MSEKNQFVPTHLINKQIKTIANWYDWLQRWESVSTFEELIGLLHAGFKVSVHSAEYGEPEYDCRDRIIFYLSIANGWAELALYADEQDKLYNFGYDQYGNVLRKSQKEIRKIVGRKAFEILCTNFFKLVIDQKNWDLLSEKSKTLLDEIQYFFRVERDFDWYNLINLPNRITPSPFENMAKGFLMNLVSEIWDLETKPITQTRENTAYLKRMNTSKLWTIEVLNVFGKLEFLSSYELDEACLAKLKEIAMRTEIRNFTDHMSNRRVISIEEACYAKSKAAEFLILRDVKNRESLRLKAISEAAKARDEAERKLRELSGQK